MTRFISWLFNSLQLSIFASNVTAQAQTTTNALNLTALSSRDGYSVIECWRMDSVPASARSALNYIVGGAITEPELSVIQPRTTPGQAWAPAIQLTAVLNGLIRITTPYTPGKENTTAYMSPGTLGHSVVVAADLNTTSWRAGHHTEFPGNEQTVLVQLPFAGNEVPGHSVLHDGPCEG